MKRLWRVFDFLIRSAALTFLFAACLVGFSCFKHGDVGPYPEVDWMWAVPPTAMFLAFLWIGGGDDA